jgi:hypothetical protein
MNEQIKQLMLEARLGPALLLHHWGKIDALTDSEQEDLERLEKFAELIVKECASICELNGQSYKYSFTPAKARLAESTSNHCGLMIKKHFGVEE